VWVRGWWGPVGWWGRPVLWCPYLPSRFDSPHGSKTPGHVALSGIWWGAPHMVMMNKATLTYLCVAIDIYDYNVTIPSIPDIIRTVLKMAWCLDVNSAHPRGNPWTFGGNMVVGRWASSGGSLPALGICAGGCTVGL